MTKIALTFIDGAVGLMTLLLVNPSPERVQQEISKSVFPTAVTSWRVIDEASIPTDRTYRNAWKDTGSAIVHDMVKARAIHGGLVRAARDRAIDVKDKEWLSAFGQGQNAAAAAVEKERKTLRALPESLGIENAQTIEELKALWPPGLPK